MNLAVLTGAVTIGKAIYDSTFAFANYVIATRPNADLTVWGALGDKAFNETLGRDQAIKERYENRIRLQVLCFGVLETVVLTQSRSSRYGNNIVRGGKLYVTKQDSFVDFFVAKFDKFSPLTGSRIRLFEVRFNFFQLVQNHVPHRSFLDNSQFVSQMELRMNFVGSNKKEAQFVMNVETFDGQWKITHVHAEDSEMAIPLEIPHIVALPQQRRSLNNVAAGYPAPPPNLQNPGAIAAPHGVPRHNPPPPPDSNNTA